MSQSKLFSCCNSQPHWGLPVPASPEDFRFQWQWASSLPRLHRRLSVFVPKPMWLRVTDASGNPVKARRSDWSAGSVFVTSNRTTSRHSDGIAVKTCSQNVLIQHVSIFHAIHVTATTGGATVDLYGDDRIPELRISFTQTSHPGLFDQCPGGNRNQGQAGTSAHQRPVWHHAIPKVALPNMNMFLRAIQPGPRSSASPIRAPVPISF